MGREVEDAYSGLRAAWMAQGGLAVPARRAALKRLRGAVKDRAEAFVRTLDEDFGGRSRHETLIAEIMTVLGAVDHALPRIARWAAPETLSVGWRFWPASARIVKQPLGVVGILGPGNFPVQLSLLPLVGAIAAGCRVLVKPSELTPATTALLGQVLAEVFPPDAVASVTGGPDVASVMTRLPLDHLLFTGSTANGRKVMEAASGALTPVTLELGGKSPVVLDRSADLEAAARAIMAGKLMNAGQTCVAPDYVLVPRDKLDAFMDAARRAAQALYPHPEGPGYTAVRDGAARARLTTLQEGQKLVPLFDTTLPPPKVAPMLVIDPDPNSPIMQEEIFGPLLPLLPYDGLQEAIDRVNSLPRPLALYWFGAERHAPASLVERTLSGTVCVNETVLHAAVESLPFGGVGASGMGAYHGRAGFDTFSHRRPVFSQSRLSATRFLQPPYGAKADRLLRLLLR